MLIPNEAQILLGLFVAFYSFVLLSLVLGMRRLKHGLSTAKPFVSVIVAARNEERTIGSLLNLLVHQDYDAYEVIIVNDRSSDQTATIVQRFQSEHPKVRRIDIDSIATEMPAKKNALAQGIASSKGEILCFTDADCLPPSGWISSLVGAFDNRTGLVAGYSPYSVQAARVGKPSPLAALLFSFVEYEEFKGAFWAAGAIGMRKAWLCTGRSLAYRRVVYDEVGGFENIKQSISGDDDLFLQLVRRETSWHIRYVTAAKSFVPTVSPPDFGQFIQQRIRHFSAGRYFPISMKIFFLSFHAVNVLVVLSFVGSLIFNQTELLVWPYLCKCIVDSVVFFTAAPVFGQRKFAPSFIFMEVLYILYNVLIGPLGFIKHFEWKPEKN
jgi:cellulose synthase/poly-beta-1,6-N-acetylglucosamine synthase-like glycosyltransferase